MEQVYVLQRPLALTKSVIFATTFMCFFSVVIALFKVNLFPDKKGFLSHNFTSLILLHVMK
jgi:hypothetical protein